MQPLHARIKYSPALAEHLLVDTGFYGDNGHKPPIDANQSLRNWINMNGPIERLDLPPPGFHSDMILHLEQKAKERAKELERLKQEEAEDDYRRRHYFNNDESAAITNEGDRRRQRHDDDEPPPPSSQNDEMRCGGDGGGIDSAKEYHQLHSMSASSCFVLQRQQQQQQQQNERRSAAPVTDDYFERARKLTRVEAADAIQSDDIEQSFHQRDREIDNGCDKKGLLIKNRLTQLSSIIAVN